MRTLIVVAVEAEAQAIGQRDDALVVIAGIGRTNAAVATTQALLLKGPFDAVMNAGVAGALPGSGLEIGDGIVATFSVYAEEGLVTPERGFEGVEGLGFPLGDFAGNAVPNDPGLRERLEGLTRHGRIATVSTCSGTDAAAWEIVRRTNALAEAMEGAAVVHSARRLGVPAVEIRVISNTTGDRGAQRWDLGGALDRLGSMSSDAVDRIGR